jgi:GNAT superfamily N-acetyltransferase
MFHNKKNFISNDHVSVKKPTLIYLKLDDLDTSINKQNGLPNNPQHYNWLLQAAEWAECKWGYMRIFPGIDKRIDILESKRKFFYLAMYEDQNHNLHLVGTFSLTPNKIDPDNERKFSKHKKHFVRQLPENRTINLSYFYVHDNYRQFGFGSQMLGKAKALAKEANMTMTAHLLTPNVHGFYEKRDAVFLTEDRSLKEPCTLVYFKKK